MALDYVRLKVTANRLITENGGPATLIKLNATPVDPARPWLGATSETTPEVTLTVTAIFVEVDDEDVDGDHVKRGDQLVFVSGTEAAGNNLGDFAILRANSEQWRIVAAQRYRPDGSTELAWRLRVRK